MAAYFIGRIRVLDPAEYQRCTAQTPGVIKAFGGRFLVRGGPVGFTEGSWEADRWVVVEFPDMASLEKWYNSKEYQQILQIRMKSATSDAVAVQGV